VSVRHVDLYQDSKGAGNEGQVRGIYNSFQSSHGQEVDKRTRIVTEWHESVHGCLQDWRSSETPDMAVECSKGQSTSGPALRIAIVDDMVDQYLGLTCQAGCP
jgi:hypothetical protein